MTIEFYSELFSFLNAKNIKHEVDYNIVHLTEYDYSLFLVLETDDNNVDTFNKKRDIEGSEFSKFLVFIWFDLWQNKREIILSKITHLCEKSEKIHARKTKVQTVSKEDCNLFFVKNHLNKPVLGYRRIGLYLNQELIALASFAKRRKFRDDTYSAELLQFATKNGIHINGGLSKLIKHFKENHSIDSLMTYIDLDWSNGGKFLKIGFTIESTKTPVYFVTNQGTNLRDVSPLNRTIFNLGSLKSIQHFIKD